MAKNRNKRKSKGKTQQSAKLSPKAYVKKIARKLPVECKITAGWEERGNAQIMAIRKRTNGQYIVGFYMVDTWCLGLKDTFFRHDLEVDQFEEMIAQFDAQASMSGDRIIECDPQLAYNIIYGCIEYAEDLGFSPPKEFATTEYILDDVDTIDYIEIEFGKDGMPYYFAGPYDNVQKNLNILSKNVGEGNFHYVAEIGGDNFDFLEDTDYTEETIRENPYSTRPEVPAIARKLTEEDAVTYLFQLQVADKAHQMFGGDLDSVATSYSTDLVEDILSQMLEDLTEEEGFEDEEEATEMEGFMYIAINTVLLKIKEIGNAEFLFAADYNPNHVFPDMSDSKD